jgi:hypothetical protein
LLADHLVDLFVRDGDPGPVGDCFQHHLAGDRERSLSVQRVDELLRSTSAEREILIE